jgi:predicted DNA-binding protein with PD1-like motif
VLVIEVRNAELLETVTAEARRHGIINGAIVSLIGAIDRFTISTIPAKDATQDVITDYTMPAEMTGTGEITDGHLHQAEIGTWFARAYVLSADL